MEMTPQTAIGKVNFFAVGQPKTGSTSLYHYLHQHPQVFLPEQKQLYYFGGDHNAHRQRFKSRTRAYYREYYNYDYSDYIRRYDFTSEALIYGDITPDYMYSEDSAQAIYDYNPEAQILITLREPVSFLQSFHRQLANSGNELEEDFWKALELEEQRRTKPIRQNEVCPPELLAYRRLVQYTDHVKRYHELFGPRVKVMAYENFKADNRAALAVLCAWLGLDAFEPNDVYANVTVRRSPFFLALRSLYVVRLISARVPSQWKNALRSKPKQPPVREKKADPAQDPRYQALKQELAGEVARVSRYVQAHGLQLDPSVPLQELWRYPAPPTP